jgi:hypothetical protein
VKVESLCKPKAESLLYAEVQPNFMERNDIKVKTENDDENADANETTMTKTITGTLHSQLYTLH